MAIWLPVLSFAEPVTLPATEQFSLKNQAGESYQIMVSLPDKPVTDAKLIPVLYVLDGNAFFGAFHDAKRMERDYQQTLIVAVGYPTDKPFDFYRRSYDFSPPVAEALNDPPQGGDAALLTFLKDTLIPEVRQRYPVDPKRQALYGHSFGGMFALYTLFNQPELVHHYIVSSPSLWWHNSYLLQQEKRFVDSVKTGETSLINRSLLLLVAENEAVQETQDIQLLAQRMRSLSIDGLRSQVFIQPDEDHMSLPITTVHRVLRQAFSPRLR